MLLVCKQRLGLLSCSGIVFFFGKNVGEHRGAAAGRDPEVRGEPRGRFADPGKRLEKLLKPRTPWRISFTLSMAFHPLEEDPLLWKGNSCQEFLAGFLSNSCVSLGKVPVPKRKFCIFCGTNHS